MLSELRGTTLRWCGVRSLVMHVCGDECGAWARGTSCRTGRYVAYQPRRKRRAGFYMLSQNQSKVAQSKSDPATRSARQAWIGGIL